MTPNNLTGILPGWHNAETDQVVHGSRQPDASGTWTPTITLCGADDSTITLSPDTAAWLLPDVANLVTTLREAAWANNTGGQA